MSTRLTRAFIIVAAVFALSCASSPNEPLLPDGRIVFRFENGAAMTSDAASLAFAPSFDSLVVRVFRGGSGIVPEVAKGVALDGVGPIEISLGCIAENHKRVSVELFTGRLMSYHGANTDVNVLPGQPNSVPVDAYEFLIDTLEVAPQPVVPVGTSYTLRWNKAQAATSYLVQSSASPLFTTIDWEQAVTDTVLNRAEGAGAHYFRVAPRTSFANGHAAGPKFGYVVGGGAKVKVNALVPSRVIPGELFTIVGENLDFPGTTATIGADNLEVVSASWDSLVVRLSRSARTNLVTVTSGNPAFESDVSGKPLVALRVAYVTVNGTYATEYVNQLESHSHDFDNSGIAVIPIEQLDTRDMNVFDVIIVAQDTGTLPVNWGDGEPSRAAVIAASPANVLAIGRGGAVFLSLVVPGTNYATSSVVDGDHKYFTPNSNAAIFNQPPHDIPTPDLGLFDVPAPTIALNIAGPDYPANVNLYASTGKSCILTVCSPNDLWAMADFKTTNTGGRPVVYFFSGFIGSPEDLNAEGRECFGNIMYLLNGSP